MPRASAAVGEGEGEGGGVCFPSKPKVIPQCLKIFSRDHSPAPAVLNFFPFLVLFLVLALALNRRPTKVHASIYSFEGLSKRLPDEIRSGNAEVFTAPAVPSPHGATELEQVWDCAVGDEAEGGWGGYFQRGEED